LKHFLEPAPNSARPDRTTASHDLLVETSKESGEDYVSLVFKGPGIGKVYANLGVMAGQDDDDVFAVIWNEPKEA
jgi:hypothetical protein